MIPESVLHYRIEKKLGEGGMGEVFLATDTKLDRKVALKFLPDSISQDPEARERLIREAKAASKLGHPNIVTIYAVEQADEHHFITMEYVEGRSLKELISSGGLDICRIIETVIQIGDGLAAAHKAGVVHRDIKPDNVILTPEGRVKIMDFGLATWRGAVQLTKEGSTVGTMAYMSPEQAQGQAVDQRTDLWSLGVILYEMVTRRLPFEGEHDAALAYSIVNEAPHPLARYSADVPDELQRIVSKCLNKNRDERYQSASDLVADLRALRRFSATGAVAVTQPSRKRSRLVAGAVVLGVAAIAVGAALLWNPFSPGPGSTTPDRKMIAVLPFENLGDPEDEYFADGMTEEVISRLAAIKGVGVISRTSVYKYKDEKKTIPEIAAELGVQYVLEGTVRWEKAATHNRIRVTPQLIEVASDAHLWSDRYDRDLTSVFEVQAEIASQVVAALGVTLGNEERNQVERRPTDNMVAYDAYMRALQLNVYYPEEVKARITLLEKAIDLDSRFVEAYGQLASDCIWLVRLGWDDDGSLLKTAKDGLNIAAQFASDNPIYLLAKCNYEYYINLDYDEALVYCQQSLDRLPNNVAALSKESAILRRQGKWQESLQLGRQAVELDPRGELWEYSQTLWCLRQLDSAMAALDRLLTLEPAHGFGTRSKAELLISWKGDFQAARNVMEKAIQTYGQVPGHNARLAYVDMCLGDYESALSNLAYPVIGQQHDLDDYYYYKGMAYRLSGDTNSSLLIYDSLLAYVDSYSAEGTPMAESIRLAERALALCLLGRYDEAVHVAEHAAEMLPVERDYMDGPKVLTYLAEVYASAGMTDKALDVVEYLLSIPCELTVPDLKYRPEWASLRDHPRFQALLERGHKVF